MVTNRRRLLVALIAAGMTFVIGYLLGWSHGPSRAESAGSSGKPTAAASQGLPPTQSPAGAAAVPQSPSASAVAGQVVAPAPNPLNEPHATVAPVVKATAPPAPHATVGEMAPKPSVALAPPSAGTGAPTMAGTASGSGAAPAANAITAPEAPAPAPPAATEGAARIQFDSTSYNWGTALVGDAVEHEFVFHNVGASKLVISGVRTSCGCTAALVTQKELAPGEEGRVKATFRTTGYKGTTQKTITIDSNDPTQQHVTLTIGGAIKVEIEVSPPTIYIRDLAPGDSFTRTITVSGVDKRAFQITKVIASKPEIVLGQAKQLSEDKYEIEVSATPPTTSGAFSGTVTIQTGSKRQPSLTVRVFANIRAAS